MVVVIYSLVIVIATVLGAIAGLGGGVIIKPLFDLIGAHQASTIGFYSSVAVFTMCIVSIIKQMKRGFQFDIQTIIYISLGSLLGGILGESIFNYVTGTLENNIVQIIQAVLLGITLILILIYTLNKQKFRHYRIQSKLAMLLVGVFLGGISVFLGIGGGPLNVASLMLLFSYEMKEATIYSIATIFFSQVSKLGSIFLKGTIMTFDLSLIPYICISAIMGGYIGTTLNQKLDNKKIERVYIALIIALIGVSCFNVIKNM